MAYSEATQILARPLILAAGILGTFEGLCWTVLSIISICCYNDAFTIDSRFSLVTHGYWIYTIFFNSAQDGSNYIVTPKAFNIFMYFYMILSFIWLILSLLLIWVMIRRKWSKCFDLVVYWTIITTALAVLDIILMSLIAADLDKFQSELFTVNPGPIEPTADPTLTTVDPTTTTTTEIVTMSPIEHTLRTIIITSYVIVMTMAARGYVLWISNIIFIIILSSIAVKMHKENRPSLLPFIDAYATGPMPMQQMELSNGNVNSGYQHDDSAIFSRGPSLAYPYNKSNNQRISNNPLANNYNNNSTLPVRKSVESNFSFSKPVSKKDQPKVAKIGKFGGNKKYSSQNVPPPNVPQMNGPYIPDPDYTPPGSPNVRPTKSVLRPKSNYVL